MSSIQRRLNLRLGVALLLIYLVFGLAASYAFRTLFERYVASRLEHDAEELLLALVPAADRSGFTLQADRISPVYERAYSGHYYQIQTRHQVIRSRSLWDQAMVVPELDSDQPRVQRIEGPDRQLLLVWTRRYIKQDQPIQIVVAESLDPIKNDVRHLQIAYALFGLVVVLLFLESQRRILRRSFLPLRSARDELIQLERGQRRELTEAVPDELYPLVRQINQLLETLQQRLQRSRNATGNLAHALKTPLARMTQQLEHLPAAVDQDIRDELQAQLQTIQALMERELKRARLAGVSVAEEHLTVTTLLGSLIDVMQQVYRDKDIQISLIGSDSIRVQADREDMLELFGNLLDNACKWAASRVNVSVTATANRLRIRIEDDGPGVDTAQREILKQRGVRADEGRVAGHGLGLAIAEDVVNHYRGELRLGRSDALGGFEVEVLLPLPAP